MPFYAVVFLIGRQSIAPCSVDTPYKAVCAWILTVFGSEDSTAGFPLDCILIGFEMLFLKGSECESREEAIEANAQEDIGKL